MHGDGESLQRVGSDSFRKGRQRKWISHLSYPIVVLSERTPQDHACLGNRQDSLKVHAGH